MEPPHGGSPSHHEHRRAGRDGRLGPRGRGAPAPLRPARLHHARGFRGRRRPAPGRARHPAGRRPAGDHRLRPAPGQLRRRAEGAAGPVARGLPRRHRTGDPRMGQRAHRRTRAGHDPRGPRVRRQRHRDPGPLPDPHGGRHQPLLPRRRDLPRDPGTDLHVRHPGRGRRRLGPLRGPGEGPPHRRLVAIRLRPGLAASSPPDDLHRVLVPDHRPVALRRHPRRAPRLAAGRGDAGRQDGGGYDGRGHEAPGRRRTRPSTATRCCWAGRPRRPV